VRAFEHGAGDVTAKHVDYPELRARIAAQLRRPSDEVLRVRDLEIDIRARLVLLAGQPTGLTQREFVLLGHLAREPEPLFTKADLVKPLWGYPEGCTTRTLDLHTCRLRRSSPPAATARGSSTCGASATAPTEARAMDRSRWTAGPPPRHSCGARATLGSARAPR
jgi:DNA-binding response OmpR family regulator